MQVTESNVLNGCYLHSCLKNCQTYLADFQGHRVFYAYYGRYIVRVMLHHSWHKFGAQFLGCKLEFLIAFSSLLSYTIMVILKLSVQHWIKVQKSKNRGIWYRLTQLTLLPCLFFEVWHSILFTNPANPCTFSFLFFHFTIILFRLDTYISSGLPHLSSGFTKIWA